MTTAAGTEPAFTPATHSLGLSRREMRAVTGYDMGPDGSVQTPFGPLEVRLHHGGPSTLFAVDLPATPSHPAPALIAINATADDVAAHRIDPKALARLMAPAPQEIGRFLSSRSCEDGIALSTLMAAVRAAFDTSSPGTEPLGAQFEGPVTAAESA